MGIQINGQTDTISSTDGSLNIGGTVTVNVTGDATGLTGTPDITVGAVTASSATISGDLTVNGTTTTLDTTLTEVDKLEVGANNTTVGVAITQSGTGDILRLYDGATQVVTVKDGGSVGIGTNNPTSKLHVNGGVLVKGPATPNINFSPLSGGSGNADISFDGNDLRIVSNSSSADVRINAYSRDNDFVLKQDGDIGIGTDNPTGKVQIDTTSGGRALTVNAPTNGTYITFETNDTPYADIGSEAGTVGSGTNDLLVLNARSTRDLAFRTNSAERLRITSGGQVNIGNSLTQTTWLTHIEGAYNKAGLRVVSGAPNYEDPFVVATSTGGERFRITGDGYVGIGATNPGADPAVGNDANILEIRRTTAGSITSGNNRRGAVLRLKHEVNWENPYGGGDDVGRIEFATGDDSTGEGLRSVIRCEAVNYYNTNDLVFDVADYASATMKERLRITNDGQINISALDGTLRNPSLTNIQRNGLIIFPSSSNGSNDLSDNHMFSIAQSQGNWLSGVTGTSHSSWGPLWTYHNGSGTYQKRAGIQYDHASSEQFKFWSSYGDFVFKTDNARSGNETAETCDTEALRITYQGRCYIPGVYNFTSGTTSNVVVDTDGQLRRATSSGKYKTDIETLQDSYADALLECRPVWYRSLADDSVKNPHYGYYGFIAEEVAEIDPRLVFWKTSEISYDENGNVVSTPCEPEPEGVQYDRFVPHLLNLVKRQKEQIETQAASIASLEARLTALEGQ